MPDNAQQRFSDAWPFIRPMLALYVLVLAIDMAWIELSGLDFDRIAFLRDVICSVMMSAIAATLWRLNTSRKVARATTSFVAMFAFPYPLVVLSQLGTRLGFPLIDNRLAEADQFLGFDWLAYREMILSSHWLTVALKFLYYSPTYQLLILLVPLAAHNRFRELERMVTGLVLGVIIVTIFGTLLPALGSAQHYLKVDPTGIGQFVAALHQGGHLSTNLQDFKGSITFPSFHTMLSVAYIIAAWSVRYLRWPMLILNVVLIFGIPLNGAHYLVDCIAGLALMVAIDVALRLLERAPVRAKFIAAPAGAAA